MLLAQEERGELLALKRVTVSGTSRVSMVYPTVDEDGDPIRDVKLYLLSDSYVGLDQQMQLGENGGARAQYVRAQMGKSRAKPQRAPVRSSPGSNGNAASSSPAVVDDGRAAEALSSTS